MDFLELQMTDFTIATILFTVCTASPASETKSIASPNAICIVEAWQDRYMNGIAGRGTGTYVQHTPHTADKTTGHVVTAAHVIEGMRGPIVVYFTDNSGKETYKSGATVVSIDKQSDAVLLKIFAPPSSTEILPLNLADKYPSVGTNVQAVGYAGRKYRLVRPSTVCNIIKVNEPPGIVVGCTGTAEHGDSGGPVLRDRELVGILTGNCGDSNWKDRHIMVVPVGILKKLFTVNRK